MCRKLLFLISFVLVLGLANSIAQAATPYGTIPADWTVIAQYHFDRPDGAAQQTIYDSNNGWDGYRGSTTGVDGDDPNWTTDVNAGAYALDFDGTDDMVTIPLQDGRHPGSRCPTLMIDVHIKPDVVSGWQGILDAGDSDKDKYLLFLWDDKVRFAAAGKTIDTPTGTVVSGQWHRITGVFYDGTAAGQTSGLGVIELYVDGVLKASSDQHPDSLSSTGNGILTFSKTYDGAGSYSFDGIIDEVTISTSAVAGNPDPANWGTVPREERESATLSWLPGPYAADVNGHDVYFGTDFDDVNDANASSSEYKGNQAGTTYDPCTLGYGETYYWRIDEVNDSHPDSPWKGNVWRFTVPEYFVVDDFERYTSDSNLSPDTWDQGVTGYLSGSRIFLETSLTYIHSGSKAMKYEYDNTSSGSFSGYPCYSEIRATTAKLGVDPNWTREGVKALDLWFYGFHDNDISNTERLYVGLEDTASNFAMLTYDGDMNNLKARTWKVWRIDLQDFNGVDLADVNMMYIGFGNRGEPPPSGGGTPGGRGTVMFDDIRLYNPRCVWDRRHPDSDVSFSFPPGTQWWVGDCVVDYRDLDVMMHDWLIGDYNVTAVEPNNAAPGLQAWYKFDDGGGTTATDSSTYGRTGTLGADPYDPSWTTGAIGGALYFDGDKDYVECGTFNPSGDANAFTIAMWTYWDGRVFRSSGYAHENAQALIAKRDDWSESEMMWQLNIPPDLGGNPDNSEAARTLTIVSPATGSVWFGNYMKIPQGEWAHIAVTYDGTDATLYINGLNPTKASQPYKVSSGTGATVVIGATHNNTSLGIEGFNGKIDEVRIYNYTLSHEEVLWLAQKGAGTAYQQVVSRVNLYDGEPKGDRVVNFRDFAFMAADRWLEDTLSWP